MLIALVIGLSVVAVVGLLVLLRVCSLLAVAAERADNQLHYATVAQQDQLGAVISASRAHLESILTASFAQATHGTSVVGGAAAEVADRTAMAIGSAVTAAGSAMAAAMTPPASTIHDAAWETARDYTASDVLPPEPDYTIDPTDSDPYLSPDRTDAAAAGSSANPTGLPAFAFTPDAPASMPALVPTATPQMPGVPLPFDPTSSSAAPWGPINGNSPFAAA